MHLHVGGLKHETCRGLGVEKLEELRSLTLGGLKKHITNRIRSEETLHFRAHSKLLHHSRSSLTENANGNRQYKVNDDDKREGRHSTYPQATRARTNRLWLTKKATTSTLQSKVGSISFVRLRIPPSPLLQSSWPPGFIVTQESCHSRTPGEFYRRRHRASALLRSFSQVNFKALSLSSKPMSTANVALSADHCK